MEPDVAQQHRLINENESLNVGSLASQYAQIAGVLAGFAFTGFAIFLTSDRPANAEAVAASLFSAFAALVLTAILYALLSGEPSPHRRAIGACVYGLPFGLAVITMFQTLALMSAGAAGLGEAVDLGRFLVLAVGPPILMARLTIAAGYLKSPTPSGRGAHVIGWVFFGLLIVGGVFMAAARPEVPLELPHVLGVAGIGLISTVAVGLVSPWVSTRPFNYVPGRWFVVVFLVLSLLAIVLFMLTADAAVRAASPGLPA
jgi:hypothetical protein